MPGGELFFDGTCQFCVRSVDRFRKVLARRSVRLVPFLDGGEESEMQLRWHDGREFGGADAIIFLSARIWWALPLRIAATLPGVRWLLHRSYRQIAARRHCRGLDCALKSPSSSIAAMPHPTTEGSPRVGWAWTALILLAALAFLAGRIPIEPGWAGDSTRLNPRIPAWLWMWLLAGALWIGFKLISWFQIGGWRALGAHTFPFAAWVGMDAVSFIEKGGGRKIPIRGALARTVAGILLIGGIIPLIDLPLLRGWLGMGGLLLILHFGLFDIAAAWLNRRGFPVRLIMAAPWRARTLAEFWGERWNRAFSDVARASVFRPLVRRFGGPTGTMAGFAFSGLAHELVISVPASGGYGLPTAYFLIQGCGVLAERRFALRKTTAGRIFLWLAVIGPGFWLFHPAFMTAVIHPFLKMFEFTNL